MDKEIKYTGVALNKTDYDCVDGELQVALNVIPEDGGLRPILAPKKLLKFSDGETVQYVHETNKFKHYIIMARNRILTWLGTENQGQDTLWILPIDIEIYQYTSIGNTLVILTNKGMYYFLWQQEMQATGHPGYLELGNHLPECPISFGLQGHCVKSDYFSWEVEHNGDALSVGYKFEEDESIDITNKTLGYVNKFIADETINKGRFLYPFYIRYAYRLYDGSLTMHSEPILMHTMVGSSNIASPIVSGSLTLSNNNNTLKFNGAVHGLCHDIDYILKQPYMGGNDTPDYANMLRRWSDIIKSVEVFISQPLYTYDQNGKIEYVGDNKDDMVFTTTACRLDGIDEYCTYYSYRDYWDVANYALAYDDSGKPQNNALFTSLHLRLPYKDKAPDDIKDTAQFYHLKSIPIEDVINNTTRTVIDVKSDYLQSLLVKELMSDDYDSHDTIIPRYAFNYNAKLNLANIEKALYAYQDASALFPWVNSVAKVTYETHYEPDGTPYYVKVPDVDTATYNVRVYVYIRQDGRDIIVRSYVGMFADLTPFDYIYYPNVNAYKAVVSIDNEHYEVPLVRHAYLNGAYYFKNFSALTTITTLPSNVSSYEQLAVEIRNKIYTSQINNPFLFPLTGINTIGTGTILGISSSVKALSEGQFGQFPLYAFTTDGVWALEVNATGGYSSKQPISRDVCINPQSITQLDGAVLFATDKGIMIISGSTINPLTELIFTREQFNVVNDLPKGREVLKLFNDKSVYYDRLIENRLIIMPFTEFIRNCSIIYDYTNKRIILTSQSCEYSFVFSMITKCWGMGVFKISNKVESYPEALAMIRDLNDTTQYTDNYLVDFCQIGDRDDTAILVITRPFKFQSHDILKTVNTIIQRGTFSGDYDINQVLYGSRNLFDWHPVWSSKDKFLRGFSGTPYRAYRLAILGKLKRNESLYGFTASFEPRDDNQLR